MSRYNSSLSAGTGGSLPHRKAVNPPGKSPGVMKDAKSSHRHSTGGAGRASPPKQGPHKCPTNP